MTTEAGLDRQGRCGRIDEEPSYDLSETLTSWGLFSMKWEGGVIRENASWIF